MRFAHTLGACEARTPDLTAGAPRLKYRSFNKHLCNLRKPVQTYIIPILFQVDQLAAGLVSRGLTKGDRLAIWLPNIREWILVQFAAAQIGLILVRVM